MLEKAGAVKSSDPLEAFLRGGSQRGRVSRVRGTEGVFDGVFTFFYFLLERIWFGLHGRALGLVYKAASLRGSSSAGGRASWRRFLFQPHPQKVVVWRGFYYLFGPRGEQCPTRGAIGAKLGPEARLHDGELDVGPVLCGCLPSRSARRPIVAASSGEMAVFYAFSRCLRTPRRASGSGTSARWWHRPSPPDRYWGVARSWTGCRLLFPCLEE